MSANVIPAPAAAAGEHAPHGRGAFAVLALGALGVVFGDIGTSPLYALRECFVGEHPITPSPANVVGICSLIFWALVLVVAVKYLIFVMRADNCGEGGILALMALVRGKSSESTGRDQRPILVALGLFGSALLYGDGVITPAISVLSALEGTTVVTHTFEPYVVPLTVAILIGLFCIQPLGTAKVGRLFGPVLAIWFVVLAALGVYGMLRAPEILHALNPLEGARFFARNGPYGLLVMGAVVLCVTGGEALYADMGHFGARPIRVMWFGVAMPALVLNYFGQGALLLADPTAVEQPFFRLAPTWALVPLVVLATLATVIASQALISAAFSLTRQAVQLGYSPPMRVVHTSASEMGQVYLPAVNWTLMVATIGLVIGFRTSTRLASAYGIAVTMTMAITSVLFFMAARELWHWSRLHAGLVSGAFLIVDFAFLGPNLLKIHTGGWFPLVAAIVVFTLMTTWHTGRRLLFGRMAESATALTEFVKRIDTVPRVAGTGVYLTSNPDIVPPALTQNLQHNKVLHEHVVLLRVRTRDVARTSDTERRTVESVGGGIWRVTAFHGFIEDVSVPDVMAELARGGMPFDTNDVTYFLRNERVIASARPGMARWREHLYASMVRNAGSAAAHFALPPGQVMEIGLHVEI